MSEATIEYKNGPNESTAYVVSEGQKTKVQMVATPAGDLELAESPNVDTGYIVIDGKKHKCALVAEVAGELKLPTSATDDTGYVIAQDGRQHKVKLVANITGGGGGTTINNQDITVTENGTYTADAGYTGLGTVEVQVPNPSTGTLSIVENGSYDVTEYATAEVNVPTGGGTTTKFGASIDTWIGDVDENGVLSRTTWTGALNFAGVKEIANSGLTHAFNNCYGITSVDLSSVQKIKIGGLNYAFDSCASLTSVDLSSVQIVDVTGLERAFDGCKSLTSVDLSSLQVVYSSGLSYAFNGCTSLTIVDFSSLHEVNLTGLTHAFEGCTGLTSVNFSSLQYIGSNGLQSAFDGCTSLTSISFPSLTDVQTNSFGSSTYSNAFRNCTALTEIHFRADMQATIEALSQYANKWGASNATIYFDLIGTITVSGVAYSRDEPNSIRVDGTKTFVAWKDASNNIVYTAATAEPAVDTPVYSDAGTTQVGTVSEVA